MRKPSRLQKGDRVGIIAPGALFDQEKFKTGIKVIKSLGLVPVFDKNIFKKDFIYAGTPQQRLQGLIKFFKDKNIKAIWCVRGGFGVFSIADDFAKIKTSQLKSKVFIGLSDVTALHNSLNRKFKIPTIYGPMVDRMGNKEQTTTELSVLKKTLFDPEFRLKVVGGLSSIGKSGKAKGELCGGTLALLTSSMGTSWEIQPAGKILFIEDIGEPAFRIDRMLTQLKQSGKLDKIKALVVGDFTLCLEKNGRARWKEVFKRHFSKAKFPVLLGVHAGHGKFRLPLPLGCRVEVKTSGKKHFLVLEGYAK